MSLTRSSAIENIKNYLNFGDGSLEDSDGNESVSASGEKSSSSVTLVSEYEEVSNASSIGDTIQAAKRDKVSFVTDGAEEIMFGKPATEVGYAWLESMLSKVGLTLEVDCDSPMDSEERLAASIGTEASDNLTQCTIFDVINNLESTKDIAAGAVVIGGISYAVDGKNLTTALGLSEMFDKLPSINNKYVSRTIGYLDLEAEFALIDRIMNESLRIGIPDILDALLERAIDDTSRKRILLGQLRQSCVRSYLDNIQAAIDECGVTACLTRVPDAINLILRYYRYRGNDEGMLDELSKVKTILSSFSPTWHQIISEDQYYGALEPFMTMSHDAEDLFLLDEDLFINVLTAQSYGGESSTALSKTMYPYIYLPS